MLSPAMKAEVPSANFVRDPERAVETTVLHFLLEFPRE
jgi:hypothetical protein